MPKVPRDVSHDALVRFLQRRGWVVEGGTRHTVLSNGLVEVAVPRHGKLKTGTVAKILKEAGIAVGEAAEEL